MTRNYEAEVIVGIEDIAINDLKSIGGINARSIKIIRDGFIRFEFNESLITDLLHLRSVIAIYSVHHFDVPRPKALLGHQNFTKLLSILSNTIQKWSSPPETFNIGAAGSDSSVMQRLKSEIVHHLDLDIAEEKGDLFLRLMPANKQQGWEALIRLTRRPLATRSWRNHNLPGALNATVAYAMTQLALVQLNSTILNLCSGTGTILIEQAISDSNQHLIALDNSSDMIQAASINIGASQTNTMITQIHGNAHETPFMNDSIDCLYADLPFGHYVGSHDENEWLYPATLEESARIAKLGAQFVLLTHEIQLMEMCLKQSLWKTRLQKKITLSGLHPCIFVLERI